MKLVIDDFSYEVPDAIIVNNIQLLFEAVLAKYEFLPSMMKLGLQAMARQFAGVLLEDAPKGADPIYHIAHKVPNSFPEVLRSRSAELTINTGRQDDTPIITAFNLSIQGEGESR